MTRYYVLYHKDPESFYVDVFDGEDRLTRAIKDGTYKHVNITITMEVTSEVYRLLNLMPGDDRLPLCSDQ